MEKLLELIEQVRFAELEKVNKLSKTQEHYFKTEGEPQHKSAN